MASKIGAHVMMVAAGLAVAGVVGTASPASATVASPRVQIAFEDCNCDFREGTGITHRRGGGDAREEIDGRGSRRYVEV